MSDSHHLTKQQHTPGPWTCIPGLRHDAVYNVFDADGNFLTCSDAEHAANAKLIAAAPELLAALKLVIDYHVHKINPLSDASILSAKQAIAKATGQKEIF